MRAALRQSRALRRGLARELGARIGEQLVDRVRSGRLDKQGLRKLFVKPLSPSRAAHEVFALLHY